MSAINRKQGALAAVLLALLILLFFHKLAFSNLILARGDTFLYFYPYWAMASAALRAGQLPLWNPHIFMGVPFLANSQAGFFYPLNWPLWLLLPVPYAASATILIHLMIGGWGAMLAGRRLLALAWPAAFLSSLAFVLGGYLTAQVEHLNQLQGLAWLPWLFVVLAPLASTAAPQRSTLLRCIVGVACLFALQLLAGHTQTAFISGTAVTLWLLFLAARRSHRRQLISRASLVLIGGGLLSLLLAAVQLLPTLELTQLSSRQGGLSFNEVLSFSWHPLHLARAILPAYDQSLFSEYVAFLPLTVLVLALIGAWRWRGQPLIATFVLLTIVGLVLALGRFTPLYWLLARLPGFNLFRVPARWLILYAFSAAMLAGSGLQILFYQAIASEKWEEWRRSVIRAWRTAVILLMGLMIWGVVGRWLAPFIPTGAESPYHPPSVVMLVGWLGELLIASVLIWLALKRARQQREKTDPYSRVGHTAAPPLQPTAYWLLPTAYFLLILIVLFLASRILPYNQLTTAEAYFDWRPSAARLAAVSGCNVPDVACHQPMERFLSLSDIFFDPGDQAEINTIYADQLGPDALYDYTVAIKEKEIIAPNLPMVYGLAAVDGFDGGVLPLWSYGRLMQLFLPEDVATTDGRLREYLDSVPEARWLDLFNARYLITDKVGDAWYEGVYFDQQHPVSPNDGPVDVGLVPSYEATELWLLAEGEPGAIEVETAAGQVWQINGDVMQPGLYRYRWPEAATAEAIRLLPCAATSCTVLGLTLVDGRDDTFQSLVPGNYRLIHSGDVKIYENLDVLPRAFMVYDWQWTADVEQSVALMDREDFDPRQTAVLVGDGQLPTASAANGDVVVASYEPERVILEVESDTAGLLVLTDANYPGWQATIDGEPTTIYTADGLFRGVFVPEGAHEVVFAFRPSLLSWGSIATVIAVLLCACLMVLLPKPNKIRSLQQSDSGD